MSASDRPGSPVPAKQALQALRESEERFRQLVASVEDYAIILLDRAGHIRSWNAGAQRVKGYREDEIVGRHFSVFYTPEALDAQWPAYELSVAAETGRFSDEGWRVRKDGSRFWANVAITALRDERGDVQGFLKITRELTEHKHADDVLRQSEERFRLIVETVQDYAIFMLDPEGNVASWNKGAELIKGYSADEIIGRHLSVFYPPEAALQGRPEWALEMAERHGRFEDEGWRLRKDGTEFWASVVITALRDARGELRGFAKITRDMTERRRMEELREADRHKDRFLALLAHELRNPLAPIRSALHVMGRPDAPSDAVCRARDIAERQLRHMGRLLDDLLDVSRIRNGRVELRKEVLGVTSILRSAVDTAQPIMEERRHHFTVEFPVEEIWLEGDFVRLEQVVNNLLTNAAKYTDPGGRISLAAERRDHTAIIRVRDSGIGIDPMMASQIFDLFVQGERRTELSAGGIGIGLTLVKMLVELHGGRVDVYSAGRGLGSEFVVQLPALSGKPAVAAPSKERAAAKMAAPVLRILVVDDNEDSADGLAMLLDLQGHEVKTAYDGATALETAQTFRPQVALLDIGMPVMSGYELARRLRAGPETSDVLLVAMTGWGQEDDRLKAKEAGFAHHLVKPFDPVAVERLLAEYRPTSPD